MVERASADIRGPGRSRATLRGGVDGGTGGPAEEGMARAFSSDWF